MDLGATVHVTDTWVDVPDGSPFIIDDLPYGTPAQQLAHLTANGPQNPPTLTSDVVSTR